MYFHYALLSILISLVLSCPNKMDDFPIGTLGGPCGPKVKCTGPVSSLCLDQICACGAGYTSHRVNCTDTVACFGKKGEPCMAGNFPEAAYPYLTNKTLWDEKLANATEKREKTKGTPQAENFEHHFQSLQAIEKSGMAGRSAEHWSCESGTCKNNKCAEGRKNPVLIPVELPKGVPNDTDIDRGSYRSAPASFSCILLIAGLPILFVFIRPPIFID